MKFICGVDVSKASLDACIEPGAVFASFDNDADGIAELAAFCRQHQASLVAMEASGGYERRAFLLLWEAGVPCAMTNPRSVRHYAEAMGVLEKTDRLDARVIARFAKAKDLRPTPLPAPGQQRLKALVARLRQVTDDLTVQKQRRASLAGNAEILASIDEVIALLRRQSRTLEGEIASMIDDDPLWAQLAQAWRSVKGVAGRTVARLMADLPEIGTYSNKAIAKLAGLAPIANDSGKRHGKSRPWRTQQCPLDPLPRCRHRKPSRQIARRFPQKVVRRRKAQNGHPHSTRPQAARPPQRKSTRRACRIRSCNLTPQIVAHPNPLPSGEREFGNSPDGTDHSARDSKWAIVEGLVCGSSSSDPAGIIISRPLRVLCGTGDPHVLQNEVEKLRAAGKS